MRIAVVGAGSWGTAFARLLLDHGHEVTLVCRDAGQARAIAETGRNPKYMPQVDLSGVVPSPGLGTRPVERGAHTGELRPLWEEMTVVRRSIPGATW